jgi:hypothetical protein
MPDPEPDHLSDALKAGSDVNGLVQFVLRESYLQTTEDLRRYAEKVRYFNQLKKHIREELCRARQHLSAYGEASSRDEIEPWRRVRFASTLTEDEHGCVRVQTNDAGEATTVKDLECYVEHLELKLLSVGDDAQLANVDLQNVLQKQQQALQMLSNVSKMLHDNAMTIIRKIGG